MSERLATDKQKAFAKSLRLRLPKDCTLEAARKLIGDRVDANKAKAAKDPLGRYDSHGRLHGPQFTFGTGDMSYEHGRMTYCDDGNGNVWCDGDDDEWA
jgi:hypothetical protein